MVVREVPVELDLGHTARLQLRYLPAEISSRYSSQHVHSIMQVNDIHGVTDADPFIGTVGVKADMTIFEQN